MHSKLNYSTILLVATLVLAPVSGQTTKPLTNNAVIFHDPLQLDLKAVPEPHPDLSRAVSLLNDSRLQQMTVELSGTLIGHSPNLSIQFVLSLQNKGPAEVKILDPLDTLSLHFGTAGKKQIPVPERVSKLLIATSEDKKNMPFPAPVVFRQIVRGNLAGYEKEEVITIAPGGKVEVMFESEPVVMQTVMQALRTETGENADSFTVTGFLALLNAAPQTGGRSLYSDPIVLALPAP